MRTRTGSGTRTGVRRRGAVVCYCRRVGRGGLRARGMRRLRRHRRIVLLRRNHRPTLRIFVILSVEGRNILRLGVLQRLGRVGGLFHHQSVRLRHRAGPRILRAARNRLLLSQTVGPATIHNPVRAGCIEDAQLLQRGALRSVIGMHNLQGRARVTRGARIVHSRRKVRKGRTQAAGILVVHGVILNGNRHGARLSIHRGRARGRLNRVHLAGRRVGATDSGCTMARNELSPLQLAGKIVVRTGNRSGSSGGGGGRRSALRPASGKHRTQRCGARDGKETAAAVNHSDPLEHDVKRKYRWCVRSLHAMPHQC